MPNGWLRQPRNQAEMALHPRVCPCESLTRNMPLVHPSGAADHCAEAARPGPFVSLALHF